MGFKVRAGNAGRAGSFPAAQDDRPVEGADNQPPQATHSRSSDERRLAKGRQRQKGVVPDVQPIYDWPGRPHSPASVIGMVR